MHAAGRDPARRPRSPARRAGTRRDPRDGLTGTLHREVIEREILRLALRSRGRPPEAACVLFDVVGLKATNAVGGFSAGDDLLRLAAATVRAACPDAAMIGRIGGDELLALFTGPHAARRAAAATDEASRASSPGLRAAWTELAPDEPPATLLDRLYAACRRDR